MKIYAISLERSVERNSYIKAQLSKLTRFPWETVGIDGSQLRGSGAWNHASNLTAGQVGCALSHALACDKIAESGCASGFVIEDDVVLPSNIDQILEDVGRVIKPDEMIALYNRTMRPEKFSVNGAQELLGMKLIYPMEARVMRTAAAYVIGADAARAIAKLNNPVRYVADNWSAFHREGAISSFRLLHPIPVRLFPFVSTLSFDRDSGRMRAMKKIASWVPFSGTLRAMRRRWIERTRERNVRLVEEPSPFR